MQRTVTHSKLKIKKTVGRKCLYLLHKLFDYRNQLRCVRTSDESWLLWDFDCLRAPKFEDDNLKLGNSFPGRAFTTWRSGSRLSLYDFSSIFLAMGPELEKKESSRHPYRSLASFHPLPGTQSELSSYVMLEVCYRHVLSLSCISHLLSLCGRHDCHTGTPGPEHQDSP